MFWGCFFYNYKELYHIWKAESSTEKAAAAKIINELNKQYKPAAKAEWELLIFMCWIGLWNKKSLKFTWWYTEADGKLIKHAQKGDIDWWYYQTIILKLLLLPFAQNLKKIYDNAHEPDKTSSGHVYVQENKVSAHNHHAQQAIFINADILCLLWPENSSDLNTIESV